MKRNLKPVIASLGALAITGGVLAASVGTAYAATPPWEPDPNALGSLTFYDASGNVVTGGSNLSHLFDYAQASSADANTGTKATLFFAQPTFGQTTGSWPQGQASVATVTPPTAAGTPAALTTSTTPVATSGSTGANLQTFIAGQTAQTQAGYVNVYQVRVATTGGGGGSLPNAQYWETDILVSGSSWSVQYPAVVTSTNTSLSATPNPALTTQSVSLSATVTPSGTAGTVDFKDGATDLGNGTYNASTGVATLSKTFSSTGSHSLTATFTPTDTSSFSGSSGGTTLVVNPPATPTTTNLVVTQDGVAGHDVNLASTVSPSAAAGTVSFYDNGSSTALNPSPVAVSSGNASFDIPAGLSAGAHSIVAKFTPTDNTQFQASQSAPQNFSLNAAGGACAAETTAPDGQRCDDTQNIEATIPNGTLTISTPYTAANPLNLGTLALNANATEFTASAQFANIIVTDNRSGGLGWVAQAQASNLVNGSHVINAQNVGLTFPTAGPILGSYTKSIGDGAMVSLTDNAAAEPAVGPSDPGTAGLGGTAKNIASSTPGSDGNNDGTVTIQGDLTLNAPTSTVAGLYTGTITFTVG